ncbi:TPA: glycoside hydrolase family 108 protein [Klebsiella pneumoniae]|uniref:glycoside hydrolase family 108 protein n=1 Tax=Klebsiella pneumoniae complex TaxID=3390273 RepID=UPI000D740EB9|nr:MULTISPECIES: glycosyl hydrolase 108 family protein [Klebsiella]MBC4875574.1 glycoside hydrolase family 108 protein [Klebsiella pneumoniae]MCA5290513.1 glycoside hydrolase family 108 protein [Klebsiella pneumoniae]MCA5301012.1 glycoside hydrolase family 108 protein [Klebsiella pneumoniae]MCA5306642.1 glycoside hydrolase family 108 protein [Klebsiella pneumoniae]MCA5311592.1 glycoside hydrolase family 108 protein [Klebsiella pneumoniae]
MTKDEIIDEIIKREAGYVNHPADRGGPTNWGITAKTALAHGYHDVKALTREQARAIYEADYWYGPRFDQVAAVDAAIADELCDSGVNMGPAVASKFLQRWLSALNLQGKLYPDLDADGRIGPRTITALQAYLKHRGADGRIVMLRGLNSSQGAKYLELAESRPANEAFLFGWMLNRVG